MNLPPQSTAGKPTVSAILKRAMTGSWRWLFGLLALALAWQALRHVSWGEVWDLLSGIGPLAGLSIAAVNLLLLPLMTARWWLLLKTLDAPVGWLSLCAYRTAANAISYLTPGPHFGGEPFSIYLLTHRQGVSLSAASTSVIVDRLLELLASFVILGLALGTLTFTGSDLFTGNRGIVLVTGALLLFSLILYALFAGMRPFSRSVFLLGRLCPFIPWSKGMLMELIVQGERMAESLFQEHRPRFFLANLLSLAHWLGVFAEFWVMSVFLGLPLSFWQLTALVMIARLAFFTPLPAGIGVLESALPWVTASFGLGSTPGVSLCLIVRFRDLVFTLLGACLAMKYLTCDSKAVIIRAKLAEPVPDDPLKYSQTGGGTKPI